MTDPSLEDTSRYPYFYATVPTDYFINKMRRQLLRHFGWKEVAILSSNNENSVSVRNNVKIGFKTTICIINSFPYYY